MKQILTLAAFAAITVAGLLAGCEKKDTASTSAGGSSPSSSENIKIGFLVKQPEEPWFQNEWKFAQKAADDNHFQLVKIGATDGEKVLAAIDNLAAQGAQGFVICTPDTKLGPAIATRASANNLKLISVDDRFLGPDGKPMEEVHHVGISATEIGRMVGKNLGEQFKARGWKPEESAACIVTYDELETARQRTEGAVETLTASGFPKDKVYRTPQRTTDIPGALEATNSLLTQHPEVKHWLVAAMNDNGALGAVRAMESRGLTADNVLAIGINGTDCLDEFKKPQPTGFWGSILLTARAHGYNTAKMMYDWAKDGKEPPPLTYTSGYLITRDNYTQVMKEQGLLD